jgi:hypothetical protein
VPELLLEGIEVYRLGKELGGAELARAPAPLVVAIGRHHDHRVFRPSLLDLAQQHQPIRARHVDVGKDHDQLRADAIGQLFERAFGRIGKMEHANPLPDLAAKALPKQFGDIGLIIDNQNADAHAALPVDVLC